MMNINRERVDYLLNRYTQKTCNISEMQELLNCISDPQVRPLLEQLTDKHLEQLKMEAEGSGVDWEFIYKKIIPGENEKAKVLPMRNRVWFRLAAAAVFIGLLVGGYWLIERKSAVDRPQSTVVVAKDVEAPKSARAMITLANGEQIFLDSAGKGTIATQGNINIAKLADGEIAYTGTSNEVLYNTLNNPRGSKVVPLTLSDGTKVLLNCESSIKYPIAFVGNERKVEITGEAYFEVSKDATKPFYVIKGETSVQVLGTHFNVNAYEDEANIKVTLLEGSVEVSKGGLTGLLKPGQQAQINSEIKLLDNADIEQVMAWKDGMFSFDKADIKTIMREVSRWYDVDVVYAKEVKELFRLKTSRNTNVSNIFKILETTGRVHLKVEGKTITVQP